MSRLSKHVQEAVGEVIFLVIGWLIGISILSGAFALGHWTAQHFGWQGSPDTFGLLSALTFLWIYERRNLESKFDRLREFLTASNK